MAACRPVRKDTKQLKEWVQETSISFKFQTLKIPRGSFDQALWRQVCLHGPLLLGRSSLPFASLQTLKIPHNSFDQALWRQAFVVTALKPAVCLHGPLLLGRSSLPFASLQTLKIPRGSFDQALWRQAFVVIEP